MLPAPLAVLQAAPPPPPDEFLAFLQALPPPVVVVVVGGMLALVGLVLYPVARALARRIEGGGGSAVRAELAALRERVGELEEGQVRLAELEERLDFSERVLARERRDPVVRGPGA